jgi:polar amino acid transport system substrate-binding protein
VGVFARASSQRHFQHLSSFEALLRDQASLLAPKVGWYGKAYARAHRPGGAGRLSTFINFARACACWMPDAPT